MDGDLLVATGITRALKKCSHCDFLVLVLFLCSYFYVEIITSSGGYGVLTVTDHVSR